MLVIMASFHSIESDLVNVRWTKVTVSGPSGTGKSSTLKLLLDEEADEKHDSTPVVRNIETKIFLPEESGKKWRKIPSMDEAIEQSEKPNNIHFIYAVDTGGQAAFLDIAPALLRYNSVNIVTHKLDEALEDETAFYYSVKDKQYGEPIKRRLTNEQVLECSIRSLASINPPKPFDGIEVLHPKEIEDTDGENKPCFIVIGTFKDKVRDAVSLLKSKNERLKKVLLGFKNNAHILQYEDDALIFPVNTLGRSPQEKRIADDIRHKICKSYMEAKIPRKWFLFQLKLNEESKMKGGILKKSVCDEIGAGLYLTPDDVNSALKFFHHLTALLYFPDIIHDIVFLDSQPLFEKLSKLIAVSFADGADYYEALQIDFKNKTAPDNMKNRGIFDNSLLIDIGFQFMEFNYESFLKLLESLQVIIQLPETQTATYFLPCVLATANPYKLSQLKGQFSKNTDPFVLKWKERVIPQGLFCALVLRLLQEKTIGSEGFIGVKKQFRNAITLPCESKFGGSLLLVDATSHLEVYYSGRVENCPHIRDVILSQVIEAAKAFHYDLNSSCPDICFIDSSEEIVPLGQCPLRSKAWLKSKELIYTLLIIKFNFL